MEGCNEHIVQSSHHLLGGAMELKSGGSSNSQIYLRIVLDVHLKAAPTFSQRFYRENLPVILGRPHDPYVDRTGCSFAC